MQQAADHRLVPSKMRLDRAKEAADLAMDHANKAKKEARECDPV
jgi:hypothetical protein